MTTKKIGITLSGLRKLQPCAHRLEIVEKLIKFGRRKVTAKQAVEAGVSLDDLVWVAAAVAHTDESVERRLRLWMADCAVRVLHIYEKVGASAAPRLAIIAGRMLANGEINAAVMAAVGGAALDAAGGARAGSAVRAAAWAAAGGAGAREAAAIAASGPAGDIGSATWSDVSAAEEKWQLNRLVNWLSDPEPIELELPSVIKRDTK